MVKAGPDRPRAPLTHLPRQRQPKRGQGDLPAGRRTAILHKRRANGAWPRLGGGSEGLFDPFIGIVRLLIAARLLAVGELCLLALDVLVRDMREDVPDDVEPRALLVV